MKISTSTSFVMAATASLALQSSALALPPDSPDVARSARTATAARLPDRAGTVRSGSRETSPTRRDLEFRQVVDGLVTTLADEVAAVEDTLKGLGVREAKGTDVSPLSPRQLPVAPAGVASQAVSAVTQASSSVPSTVAGTVNGTASQGPAQLPGPLASSVPEPLSSIPNSTPQPSVPAPVDVAGDITGIVQDAPDIPEVASGPAQIVGSTVGGAIPEGIPVFSNAAEEGAKEGSADGYNAIDDSANTAENTGPAEDEAPYSDSDTDDDDGDFVDATGLASPSSTVAAPSSSPSSSPAVTSTTDFAIPLSSDFEFDKEGLSIHLEGVPGVLGGVPTSGLSIPVPIPSSLPVNPPSLPVPQLVTPAASLPVDPPSGLPSLSAYPLFSAVPVNAPSLIPVKHAETTSGEISEVAQSAALKLIASSETPPLLQTQTTGETGASASASLIDPFSTVSSASQPASRASTVAFEPVSSSVSSGPSTNTPSRLSRFRFFRFARKINA